MSRLKAPVSTALTRVALSPAGLGLVLLVPVHLQVLLRRRTRQGRAHLLPQAHPARVPRHRRVHLGRVRQAHRVHRPLQLNGTGERVFHRFTKALPVATLRSHT